MEIIHHSKIGQIDINQINEIKYLLLAYTYITHSTIQP